MRFRFFATVARELEQLASQELEELGAQSVQPGFCGVSFTGDLSILYRVNLWARLPFRVLMHVAEFPCKTANELYQGVHALDWQTYLTPQQTLSVKATGRTSQLNHTHFTALQVKNAIVNQQNQRHGFRSDVDPHRPDVLINVHLYRDRCTVSLDSSGTSLHRRGYRPAVGAAPLKESLAAALIKMTHWQVEQPFMDPLCGSGTLPLEASLTALNRAPGLFRDRFGFESWPNFDADLWQHLRQDAQHSQRQHLAAPIVGSDVDGTVLQQARLNATHCGVDTQVQFEHRNLAQVEAPGDHGVLLCNPPYGERLGKKQEVGALYKLLGNVLKQRFKGWTAFVLSGNKELAQTIGLKSSERISVYNGALPCRLMKYELY